MRGADGLVGAAAFAAMRDDHTLPYSFAAPVSVFPVLQEKRPYDQVRDPVPISSGAVACRLAATANESAPASEVASRSMGIVGSSMASETAAAQAARAAVLTQRSSQTITSLRGAGLQ